MEVFFEKNQMKCVLFCYFNKTLMISLLFEFILIFYVAKLVIAE